MAERRNPPPAAKPGLSRELRIAIGVLCVVMAVAWGMVAWGLTHRGSEAAKKQDRLEVLP